MPRSHLLSQRKTFLCAGLFLLFHFLGLRIFHSQIGSTYPFLILSPLFALYVCCARVRSDGWRGRTLWLLLSAGLFLWSCGITLSAWEEMSAHIPFAIAWFSDFVFFMYGAPVLLAISSAKEDQQNLLFFWMDGVQAILTAYLTYIAIFSVVPFAAGAVQPISDHTLELTYNIENFVLAIAAGLRLLARPRGNERAFYRTLCIFLWTYAGCTLVSNRIAILMQGQHGAYELLVDIPFLVLGILALSPPTAEKIDLPEPKKNPVASFMENGSPVFYTVALLILGTSVMRRHYLSGTVAIFTALTVYVVRTTLLQSQYAQSQERLREARDRLEVLSLEDGLTKVGNRRYFDRMLDVEWNRMVRAQDGISLILIDIDHFKTLNDRDGHPAGDRCLIEVARALQSILPRSGDHLARYGGEEFAVILPATDRAGAVLVAEKMRDAVRSLGVRNAVGARKILTISFGIAVCGRPEMSSSHALIEAADRALYRAKEQGRDRIEVSSIEIALSEEQARERGASA
jgi:diguanylate cyclase (GGDEF)-like protein